MSAALRLVRDDDDDRGPVPPPPAAPESRPVAPAPASADAQAMLDEIKSLRAEVDLLHRRDETLNYYMQRLDEELRLAARLQQDFLPKLLPQLGPVHFHTLYRPAGYVSGDLYDVVRLDEEHIGFFMADAVGHGMPAALLTMFIKNALQTKQISGNGYRLLAPGESLSALNQMLVSQNLTQATFATAFYGIVNVRTLQVDFARAGHPSPILIRANGDLEPLESDGGLLGIFPDERYADACLRMHRGDRLFVFSDGIEVAFSDEKTMDTAAWHAELSKRATVPTEQLLMELTETLDGESGSITPKDDLSMVVLEIK